MRLIASPLMEEEASGGGGAFVRLKDVYFPSSGSAAISPAFDASWTDTSGAVRLPASFVRANTSDVDTVSATPTGVKTYRRLVYQFVLPLLNSGIYSPPDRMGTYRGAIGSPPIASFGAGSGTLPGIKIKAKTSAGSGFSLCSCMRLVDPAGNLVVPNSRSLTATLTGGSATITSAGLFLPTDVGAELYASGVALDFLPYNVLSFTSTSALVLGYPIDVASPWIGTRTIQLRRASVNVATSYPTDLFDTTVKGHEANDYTFLTFGGVQADPLGTSASGLNFSLASCSGGAYYLVIEVGHTATSTAATLTSSFNITTRLGDSSAAIVSTHGTTGSTGIKDLNILTPPPLLIL